MRRALTAALAALRRDLQHERHSLYAGGVALVTVLATAAYYASIPQVERDPDTPAFLDACHHIATQGVLVDPARLPGYPLLMCAVFSVAGWGNYATLSAVQAGLFVAAAVEVYVLLHLILRRPWAAAIGAALVGTNATLLSYAKPVMSEALALFLVVNLALAIALCLRDLRPRTFWPVVAWLLALFMTRPEWIFLPPLLFVCLLALALRRGRLKRLLPHALAGLVVLYGVLGLYVAGNAAHYRFTGITFVSNINLLGKVMQYRMQDEAPPQYAAVTSIVDDYLARGDADPWHVTGEHTALKRNFFALAGQYSTAIIVRHPAQYMADSVPVFWLSLLTNQPYRPLPAAGALPQLWAGASTAVLGSLVSFPVLACGWWALLLAARRKRLVLMSAERRMALEAGAIIALLAAYGLVVTTLGTYSMYERLHEPFDPLLIVVVWSAVVAGFAAGYERLRGRWEGGAQCDSVLDGGAGG